jgi:hypothetical protein
VASIFDTAIYTYDTVNVQTITDQTTIHVDSRRSLVYNFLIEQGNPGITTSFYKDPTASRPEESHIIQPRRWHGLKVNEYHQVTGFVPGDKRIAVCVFKSH